MATNSACERTQIATLYIYFIANTRKNFSTKLRTFVHMCIYQSATLAVKFPTLLLRLRLPLFTINRFHIDFHCCAPPQSAASLAQFIGFNSDTVAYCIHHRDRRCGLLRSSALHAFISSTALDFLLFLLFSCCFIP